MYENHDRALDKLPVIVKTFTVVLLLLMARLKKKRSVVFPCPTH